MEDLRAISIQELVQRCSVAGEPGAWEEFVRRFHRLIAAVVLRTMKGLGDSSPQIADDLIQETYLKLCGQNLRLIRDFDHKHPNAFLGFVKVVAANVVRDHFKSSLAQKRGLNQIQEVGESFIPIAREGSAGSLGAIERSVLLKEVQELLDICSAGTDGERNKRIFWLYYRAGLSAGAIAALPEMGLSTKGVESIILRITKELRKRMASSRLGASEISHPSAEGVSPAESF